MRAVVRRPFVEMVRDHYDRILTEKTENAHDFGIFNLFLAITYPMWGLPVTQLDEGLKLMEEYINHPRVVGVGEGKGVFAFDGTADIGAVGGVAFDGGGTAVGGIGYLWCVGVIGAACE